MNKPEIGVAATMGIGTVQAFTTFVGSVGTADMMDSSSYQRQVGLALGWSFLFTAGFAWWAKSYSPFVAWLVTSGAMYAAYEYQRDRVNGEG